MFSAGSGADARSVAASGAREPASSSSTFTFPVDRSSSSPLDRENRYGRADRDRFSRYSASSVRRDCPPAVSPSFIRSPSLFSNGSLASKKRTLGRYGAAIEENGDDGDHRLTSAEANGRHGSSLGCSPDSPGMRFAVPPAENSKAGRDVCIQSPGYSSSPGMDRLNKDLTDEQHFREPSLSPVNRRPASSPRLRTYRALEGSDMLDGERLKHSNYQRMDATHHEWDFRERALTKPEYHRRTCSLPKLASPRDWTFGDRVMEGRIDRYGSGSVRDFGFSDGIKDHCRPSSNSLDKSLYPTFSSRAPMFATSSSFMQEAGSCSLATEGPESLAHSQSFPMRSSGSVDAEFSDYDYISSKKRPRLAWGQGLAKYEKEKTEEDPSPTEKDEVGTEICFSSGGSGDTYQGSHQYPNLSVDPGSSECLLQQVGVGSCSRLKEDSHTAGLQHTSFGGKEATEEEKPLQTCDGSFENLGVASESRPVGALEPMESNIRHLPFILQEAQASLHVYESDASRLCKNVLTQQVERLEFEIDMVEKEIKKLESRRDEQLISLVEEEQLESSPGQVLVLLTDGSSMQTLCSELMPLSSPASDAVEEGNGVAGNVQDSLLQEPVDTVLVESLMVDDKMRIDTTEEQQVNEIKGKCSSEGVPCKDMQHEGIVEVAQGPFLYLLRLNQAIAKHSSDSLSHLLRDYGAPGAFGAPSTICVDPEGASARERTTIFLETKVAEEKSLLKFKEKVLALKYRLLREFWKQEHVVCDEENNGPLHEIEGQDDGVVQNHRSTYVLGQTFLDAMGMSRKLLVNVERAHSRMPLMVLQEKIRAARIFVSRNGLVEDPYAAEQERKGTNPWSMEERKVFLDKFSMFGKNFKKIASCLENKTVADCVEFYYRNQKSEEFEKVHRRHKLKKRRECIRVGASYMATMTSFNSRRREENASCVAGLSLVAAAAAVMSVPGGSRDYYTMFESTSTMSEAPVHSVGSGSSKGLLEDVDLPWTDKERECFTAAVSMFGKDFHSISLHVGSKSQRQCKMFFSKTRKRLCLDKLVDHHLKANSQGGLQPSPVDLKLRESGVDEVSNMETRVGQCHLMPGQVAAFNKEEETYCLQETPTTVNASVDLSNSAVVRLSEGFQSDIDPEVEFDSRSEHCGPQILTIDGGLSIASSLNQSQLAANEEALIPNGHVPAHGVFDVKAQPEDISEVVHLKTEPVIAQMEPSAGSNEVNCISGTKPPVAPATVTPQPPYAKERNLKLAESKTRREPTSWTPEEKEKFLEIIKNYGKNWVRLCESLPSKSLTQIKTYFQNSKAKLGLAAEGTASTGGAKRKRKTEDLGSSSNIVSPAHVAQNKVILDKDEVANTMKAGVGNKQPGVESLVSSNNFGGCIPPVLEGATNLPRAFCPMGVVQPFRTPVFNAPDLFSVQQSQVQSSLETYPLVSHQQSQLSLTPLLVSRQLDLFQSQFYPPHLKQQTILPHQQQTPQQQVQNLDQQLEHTLHQQAQLQQLYKQVTGSSQLHLLGANLREAHQQPVFLEAGQSAAIGPCQNQALLLETVCDGVEQPAVNSQESPLKSQETEVPACDVKLFGQSLLSQRVPFCQQGSTASTSASSSSFAISSFSREVPSVAVGSTVDSSHGSQEEFDLPCQPQQLNEGKPPSNMFPSVGDAVDPSMSQNVAPLDHESISDKSKGPDFNQLSAALSGVQMSAPRVVEALVALAEWRLQNSSNSIDDFLSQSWEALCRDPGSLLEVGKASGSLTHVHSGGLDTHHHNDLPPLSQPHLMHLPMGLSGNAWHSGALMQLIDPRNPSPPSFHPRNGGRNSSISDGQGVSQVLDGTGGGAG